MRLIYAEFSILKRFCKKFLSLTICGRIRLIFVYLKQNLMSYLAQAIGELKSKIHTYLQQSTNELVRFQVKLDKVDLLAWLKGQSAYPQFYLHFRDEEKALAALSEVQSFSQLNLAQEFIEESGFPLVGGLQFQGTAQFVLPKFLLNRMRKVHWYHFCER